MVPSHVLPSYRPVEQREELRAHTATALIRRRASRRWTHRL